MSQDEVVSTELVSADRIKAIINERMTSGYDNPVMGFSSEVRDTYAAVAGDKITRHQLEADIHTAIHGGGEGTSRHYLQLHKLVTELRQ